MKKIIILIFLLLMVIMALAEKVGIIKEINKPNFVSIYKNELYIIEGASIYLYSLNNLQLIRKIGREGEGPGELRAVLNYSNHVTGYPEYILAESMDKIVYYTRRGKLIKEIRKPGGTTFTVPLGKNYVLKRLETRDNRITYNTVNLYDADMKKIKKLYQQEWIQQGNVPGKIVFAMIGDFINIAVWDNKLFIEESAQGFFIEVFNDKGNKIYQIKKEYETIAVTEKHKREAIGEFKEDPLLKPQIRAFGGWNQAKKLFSMKFPSYFPALLRMEIDQDKLYLTTHRVKNGRQEIVILNLKGNKIKIAGKQKPVSIPLTLKILGVNLSVLKDNKIYYLQENETTEQWELHIEKLGKF